MKHASLFSGIGGFDLAAEWVGWENVFQVEIDEFCQKLLTKNFPNVKKYKDINEFDGTKFRGTIDVVSGGFPCQKYSRAGKQKGNDPLKYETLRVLSEILPAWAVLENVSYFISKKFAKEHDELCSYLENIGYEVQTYDIEASSCGLPTMERHIWIIASNTCVGIQRSIEKGLQNKSIKRKPLSDDHGIEGKRNGGLLPSPKLCRVGERISRRVDRLRGLGNSVGPPQAYEIFKCIDKINSE